MGFGAKVQCRALRGVYQRFEEVVGNREATIQERGIITIGT